MDIVAMSTAMASMDTGAKVSMAVMNMAKDQIMQDGQQMVEDLKAMCQSVQPHLGSSIDISI